MANTLQNIIKKFKSGSNLKLVNEHFSNEVILNQSLQCSISGDITFLKVDFRNVDFVGSHIVAYNFKNCIFSNVMLIKCEFWNTIFENCQFENCNFINVKLTASHFSDFEFIETKFKDSNLDSIIVRCIKVSRSKQSIEIEQSFNLEKILRDMNLIISSDQDEI